MILPNRNNPQPSAPKSVDRLQAPGLVSLSKAHTCVTQPGVVSMVDVFAPGARKLVSNATGDGEVVVDGLAVLKKHGAWAFLENTGDGWACLYLGGGAVRSKKTKPRGNDS